MTDNKTKRPTGDEIRGRLLEGNFGALGTPPLTPSEPISVTQMVLKLRDIKPYDKNPRRIVNPKYREIKESIRSQRGLTNALGITRRPGEEYYMVQSGGNTRLMILKELYQETRDESFNSVQCLYYPWISESSVLTAHFIENELRGTMALVDKAYGIQMLRGELELERGEALSDKAFLKLMTEKGFKLSQRQASRLKYVLELDQIIPIAIREGMTTRDIDIIKNTEGAYSQFCEGKTNQFPILFAKTMADRDGEFFDLDRVRTVLERELDSLVGIPYNRIALEIEAILQQQAINRRNDMSLLTEPMELEEGEGIIATTSSLGFYTLTQGFDTGIPAYARENIPENPNQPVPLTRSHHSPETKSKTVKASPPQVDGQAVPILPAVIPDAVPVASHTSPQAYPAPEVYPVHQDLAVLQQHNYALAVQIARMAAIEHSVIECSEGVGFELEETAQASSDLLKWGIGWLLQGLALPYQEVLPNALKIPKYSLIDATGKSVTWPEVPYRLFNDPTLLSDSAWQAIVKLIGNSRTIRQQTDDERLHASQ